MRKSLPIVVSLAVLCVACQPTPGPTTTSSSTSTQAAALCGGGVPAGLGQVVAGTETPFFTAASRRVIRVKPGVRVSVDKGEAGRPPELTLVALDNSGQRVRCGCPDGCGGSCGLILSTDPTVAPICDGDCATPNSCCSGCAFFTVP